ncbi:MAG: L-histidine N(alpha)-methyltransferase [Gammaproteobacteria bacterium]|nr:L-histidine N(alpha)-methyltransferase [Gammaproteobacteria bacterium]MCB1922554.1 L-histidine N(alpha)-methyltransferase [Gammaproteobacteria bacterium]
MNPQAVTFYDAHPGTADLRAEVLSGLSAETRAIPAKFFYDERGSALFDRICELPEYYQTRTEMAILRRALADLVELIGPQSLLIELGSGASRKVRLLLEELRPRGYVGVDISKEFLLSSTRRLAHDYPWLDVHAACVDFSAGLELPACGDAARKVAFFPGSSIGNFDPDEAVSLLRDVADMVGPGGQLLIGVDLKKPVDVLNAAYNDSAGVTAEFNRNLLQRIRQELVSDVDPGSFEHYAFYNPVLSRIEMHLVSRDAQCVHVDGAEFAFERGDSIHTENSYKYSVAGFGALAQRAGFVQQAVWTDDAELFSVQLLRRASRLHPHA